ncbi:hypothetical protein GRI89_00850 [Altererythrobacter salegens]|uniref:Uncharacterized protein n=1 Tax=Croceibacterium salegens TaxID=1737568 RepID=A0A6I4SQK0_9SPHN|nr:hypothetical protein [Croceibacterium salegens]MXO58094.1 hypothetical protein [Croceibacterium salegens]
MRRACLAMLALSIGSAANAQAIKNEPPMRHFTEEEIAAVQMPALDFQATPEIAADYDKYFFFHRANSSFDEAYADITECDALSSGANIYLGASDSSIAAASAQYGMAAGVIGGAIAGAMMDAIFGSAERRKQRRTNMRTCMHFKEYDRYGLEKDLWQSFNFEEGNDRADPEERKRDLLMQARVASASAPNQEVLEP